MLGLLEKYGVTDRAANEATLYADRKLGRVVAQYRGLYKVVTMDGEYLSEVSGKLRFQTDEWAKFPAVGDFVMVDYDQNGDRAVIYHALTRKSAFLRTSVGVDGQAQVIAANIDTLFICMSLNENFNLSRLERYLSVAWDSGATPVIVLTKSDLCADLQRAIADVERISAFSDIIVVSMFEENPAVKFQKYLQRGQTTAFVGSSGVGKSTLINKLLGADVLETREIGKDDKGRHTTTGREMFPCPMGGVVIDTPGMRELGAESVDLSMSFDDLETIARNCRFSDCTHTGEPGCALQEALNNGVIDQRRLENYFKLKLEAGYDGLNSKEIEAKKLARMFKDVGGMKHARKIVKEKKSRR